MWPNLVVVSAPSLAFSHRVVEAHEPVLAQAFRAELAVEAFDERIVGRLARPAEVERYIPRVGPKIEIARDELAALIDPDRCRIAAQLGIDDIEANVLPDQKAEVVRRLRAEGRIVAMAGDGVSDAPALAAADVGIAKGTGTDVVIESAGVTLLKGDLGGIVRARRLSRATMRNIRQNLALAFVYNAAGIPVAAGILYPVSGVLLSPSIAAAAMALSSVSVVGNALRLRTMKI